jgi:hypothetical protein
MSETPEPSRDGAGLAISIYKALGPFCFFQARQLLLEGNTPIGLSNRALELLAALVERLGEVSKAELTSRAGVTARDFACLRAAGAGRRLSSNQLSGVTANTAGICSSGLKPSGRTRPSAGTRSCSGSIRSSSRAHASCRPSSTIDFAC